MRRFRFQRAVHEDRMDDGHGCYGKYELLRDLQPQLMFASEDCPVALMYVDMNGLKQINDTQGHDVGDAAIGEFRNAVRAVYSGHLYRLGGDEFALFVAAANVSEVTEIARRMLASVASRSVGGKALSASVGVAIVVDPNERPEDILKRADEEMYTAKAASKRVGRPSTLKIEGRAAETLDQMTDREQRSLASDLILDRKSRTLAGLR